MKKSIAILFLFSILLSCGPKRARCYGKRCVETSIKKESSVPLHRNS